MTEHLLIKRAVAYNGFPEYPAGTPFRDIPYDRQVSLHKFYKDKTDKFAQNEAVRWEEFFGEASELSQKGEVAETKEYTVLTKYDLGDVVTILRDMATTLVEIKNEPHCGCHK